MKHTGAGGFFQILEVQVKDGSHHGFTTHVLGLRHQISGLIFLEGMTPTNVWHAHGSHGSLQEIPAAIALHSAARPQSRVIL